MTQTTDPDPAITLKGRAREIFLELCAEVDCLPYGSALPSIRELRRRYNAGQQTIAKVLKYLSEYRSLKSHPRKRTRLSEPVNPASGHFVRSESLITGQYQNRCTALGMLSDLRDRWERYIVDYNRTHPHKITIRYAATPEELAGFAADTDIDFILFHTKPVAIDLLKNTADFIDLRSLCAELDKGQYYPGTFMTDPDHRIWGISPGFILPVISCRREFCPEYPHGLNWDELYAELRRLKRQYPQLSYSFCLNGYILYLFSQGVRLVDPVTRGLRLDYGELKGPLEQLRELTREKLLPLFSDAHYQGIGKSLFFERKIAMAQFFGIPMQSGREYGNLPTPLTANARGYCGAEAFHICMHSLRYKNAWDFIKYILSADVQRRLVRHAYPFPARRDLIPENFSEETFAVFRDTLERTGYFPEDYFFPVHLRMILEAGIDRWIELGGQLEPALREIERACRQHMKTATEQIKTEA